MTFSSKDTSYSSYHAFRPISRPVPLVSASSRWLQSIRLLKMATASYSWEFQLGFSTNCYSSLKSTPKKIQKSQLFFEKQCSFSGTDFHFCRKVQVSDRILIKNVMIFRFCQKRQQIPSQMKISGFSTFHKPAEK